MSLYDTGPRPAIDAYLLKQSKERRDYGEFWSASSGGYCMRKVIFDRLQVPYVNEDPRKQRVFSAGYIFHSWVQEVTKESGISIAQELELIDDDLHIKGHIDDLLLIDDKLLLVDYKTVNSQSFNYKRDKMSHYHRYQLGTYVYMLKRLAKEELKRRHAK